MKILDLSFGKSPCQHRKKNSNYKVDKTLITNLETKKVNIENPCIKESFMNVHDFFLVECEPHSSLKCLVFMAYMLKSCGEKS